MTPPDPASCQFQALRDDEPRTADDLAIASMLLLCGEAEVRDYPSATPAKLRALIDGLIVQRRRADAALATQRAMAAENERMRVALDRVKTIATGGTNSMSDAAMERDLGEIIEVAGAALAQEPSHD